MFTVVTVVMTYTLNIHILHQRFCDTLHSFNLHLFISLSVAQVGTSLCVPPCISFFFCSSLSVSSSWLSQDLTLAGSSLLISQGVHGIHSPTYMPFHNQQNLTVLLRNRLHMHELKGRLVERKTFYKKDSKKTLCVSRCEVLGKKVTSVLPTCGIIICHSC